MPLTPTLPDRLRGGDATALLELAHATHPRALAVARASSWGRDPEALLLDAYVALWLRRADAPAAGAEQWALAEVLAYCARQASARQASARQASARQASARRAAGGAALWGALGRRARRAGRSTAGAAGAVARMVARMLTRPRALVRPASPFPVPAVGRPTRPAR